MTPPSASLTLKCLLASALIWAFAAGRSPADAQDARPGTPLQYTAAVHAAAGTADQLPFWLAANQYGTIDPTSSNLGLRLGVHRPFAPGERFDYAFGADVVGRASARSALYIHQLYGRLRYGPFQLTGGRREQMIGRVDTALSLGSTTWSKNASPPSKISLSTASYVAVPGTHKGIAFNGYIAHGWLGDDRFVEGTLLHEKYLYVRLMPPSFPVRGHAGITHHVMWGGTHPRLGPQPSGFSDFLDLLLGGRNDEETVVTSTPSFANHIATYDFSLEADIGALDALVYRHFYHEDTPSLNFRNPWDGLWGVSLRRPASKALVTGFLWEHLVMTRHNAKYSEGQERGEDTYYNHSLYESGWTYQGRTLGLPLFLTAKGRPGISNNIVVAHHIGVEGTLPGELEYRLLGTYSRNYGAQKVCVDAECTAIRDERTPRRDQYSFLLDLTGTLSERYGLQFNTSLALDAGELYDNRVGLSAGISWNGTIDY